MNDFSWSIYKIIKSRSTASTQLSAFAHWLQTHTNTFDSSLLFTALGQVVRLFKQESSDKQTWTHTNRRTDRWTHYLPASRSIKMVLCLFMVFRALWRTGLISKKLARRPKMGFVCLSGFSYIYLRFKAIWDKIYYIYLIPRCSKSVWFWLYTIYESVCHLAPGFCNWTWSTPSEKNVEIRWTFHIHWDFRIFHIE